jgi:hypothetical protein
MTIRVLGGCDTHLAPIIEQAERGACAPLAAMRPPSRTSRHGRRAAGLGGLVHPPTDSGSFPSPNKEALGAAFTTSLRRRRAQPIIFHDEQMQVREYYDLGLHAEEKSTPAEGSCARRACVRWAALRVRSEFERCQRCAYRVLDRCALKHEAYTFADGCDGLARIT